MIPSLVESRPLDLLRLSLRLPNLSSEAAPNETYPSTIDYDTRVIFDLSIQGKKARSLDIAAADLHLPLSSRDLRNFDDNDATIPDHTVTELNSALPASNAPLWLTFAPPCGYLTLLPWERLLTKGLRRSVLRLPYADVQPVVSRDALDVILCFSFPVAKQLCAPKDVLSRFLDEFPSRLATRTSLHVFADREVQPSLKELSARYAATIYDPRDAAKYAVPEETRDPNATSELESPWLLWMRDALGGRSIDVVHFTCHGYIGRDQGALAFAESPVINEDENWARFVGARQLAQFMDQIGAWSATLSSPPGNYSISGLRLLEEQIARLRPGPFLFHDMDRDNNRTALMQAYQFLYAGPPSIPDSDALTIYCHPDLVFAATRGRGASSGRTARLVQSLTLASEFPETLEGTENTPSWLASRQRSLERSVATLSPEPVSEADAAVQAGTEAALRFASDVYARHARRMGGMK